ncbi:hypothetical protein GQ44DRAFT_81932 [Phaeosphaeriaceae sp. PMI808]|nr:hypothetical protein GQ44DRAFT_81932 [Phaeosphaeriaceae sp. PMI808]
MEMNPDRARLLSTAPWKRGYDPDQDLYEPRPAVLQPRNKTGSNDIPLGPPRLGRRHNDQTFAKANLTEVSINDSSPTPNLFVGLVDRTRRLVESTGGTSDENYAARPAKTLTEGTNRTIETTMLVGNHPIALWIGDANAKSFSTKDLIKGDQIPSDLANVLLNELRGYIQRCSIQIWKEMPPMANVCILQYLFYGRKPPSSTPQLRACTMCLCPWYPRPCALLQEIDGVCMVVFMPLLESFRGGSVWTDKNFWMLGAK